MQQSVAAASTKLLRYLNSQPSVSNVVSEGIQISPLYDYGCGSATLGTYEQSKCDYSNPHVIGFEATMRVSFDVTLAAAVEVTMAAVTSYGADQIVSLTNIASDALILRAEKDAITTATKNAIYKANTAAAALTYLNPDYASADLTLAQLTCTSSPCSSPSSFHNSYSSSPLS